jgi:hypothetical protein
LGIVKSCCERGFSDWVSSQNSVGKELLGTLSERIRGMVQILDREAGHGIDYGS